jgi:hypothetical protein
MGLDFFFVVVGTFAWSIFSGNLMWKAHVCEAGFKGLLAGDVGVLVIYNKLNIFKILLQRNVAHVYHNYFLFFKRLKSLGLCAFWV